MQIIPGRKKHCRPSVLIFVLLALANSLRSWLVDQNHFVLHLNHFWKFASWCSGLYTERFLHMTRKFIILDPWSYHEGRVLSIKSQKYLLKRIIQSIYGCGHFFWYFIKTDFTHHIYLRRYFIISVSLNGNLYHSSFHFLLELLFNFL